MKYDKDFNADGSPKVALFTRAWIEIVFTDYKIIVRYVALFTRAWIEIASQNYRDHVPLVALFTRAWIEIGEFLVAMTAPCVALFTRAWIEIESRSHVKANGTCRPLHEGVD